MQQIYEGHFYFSFWEITLKIKSGVVNEIRKKNTLAEKEKRKKMGESMRGRRKTCDKQEKSGSLASLRVAVRMPPWRSGAGSAWLPQPQEELPVWDQVLEISWKFWS